jgi:predicted nucleotidyltransferase
MEAIQEQTTDEVIQEMVERIVEAGKPDKVILFGSRVRGDARQDSDYDLLVIEPSDLPRYKRATKYRRALVGLGLSKDILVWTPQEVAEWRNVPNAFITTAMNEGRIVYERPN